MSKKIYIILDAHKDKGGQVIQKLGYFTSIAKANWAAADNSGFVGSLVPGAFTRPAKPEKEPKPAKEQKQPKKDATDAKTPPTLPLSPETPKTALKDEKKTIPAVNSTPATAQTAKPAIIQSALPLSAASKAVKQHQPIAKQSAVKQTAPDKNKQTKPTTNKQIKPTSKK